MNVSLEMTVEEAQAVISAVAMQNPLVKKLADQVTAQQQQLTNGELKDGDIIAQRGAAGRAKAP